MLCWLFSILQKCFSHCQKVNPFFAGVVDVKSDFPLFYEFLAFIQSNKDDPAYMYDMNNNRRNKAQQVLRTGKGYV